jgi:4-hydroxy-tetrahydrodipicolinate reductase
MRYRMRHSIAHGRSRLPLLPRLNRRWQTAIESCVLPRFVVSTEVLFGLPDERLSIRHDADGTPAPSVAGTLLAVRVARSRGALARGLD